MQCVWLDFMPVTAVVPVSRLIVEDAGNGLISSHFVVRVGLGNVVFDIPSSHPFAVQVLRLTLTRSHISKCNHLRSFECLRMMR